MSDERKIIKKLLIEKWKDDTLNMQEIAEVVGVSYQTIFSIAKELKLPRRKLGRKKLRII